MINAKEYITTGFSIEDAKKIYNVIEKQIKLSKKITIDFTGVKVFTTLFFNNALTQYVVKLSPEVYMKKFEVINLSEIGQVTYNHSLENAINYYKLSQEKRIAQDEVVNSTDDLED